MSFVRVVPVLAFGLVSGIVIACTGGGGTVDQGGDNGDQNGSITAESSGNVVSSNASSTSSGSSTSGASGTSSSTSTSSSSSGTTYTPQADLLASSYNQSCTKDSDCYPVQEGAICTPCGCSNASVTTGDYVKFVTEFSKRKSACDPATLTGGACAPCQTPAAHCDTGTKKCAFGKAVGDAG